MRTREAAWDAVAARAESMAVNSAGSSDAWRGAPPPALNAELHSK